MRKKILALALSAVLLTACNENMEENKTTTSAMKVNVIQPQSIEFARTLQLSGSWVARDEIAISTALQGQQILSVLVDVGANVKKGQVLATLENTNVQSQLQQNQASLTRAKANLNAQESALKEANATLKRYQALIKSDAVSHQELDQQKAKADSAKASVQAAKAEIAQIQAQLEDSRHQRGKAEIIAPFDGVITKRTAEVGSLTGSNALFHLAKDGVTELEVDATTDELVPLATGLTASLKDSTHASGQIRLIFPEIDAKSRLGKIRVAFDKDAQMPIGAFGEVEIALPKQNVAFAVPFSAVSFKDGQSSVMVVNGQGKVERRAVTVGSQYQSWVEVRSGVDHNDQLVKQAGAFLDVGDVVSPQLVKDKE
ncbi:efflux RND transporter periplasmic adaptor subunit [Caviibacterium pharyngocola]|uniref:Efflux RND transporter periplasmic adaptor subunit n=1 Tax=Caviibacterium pharyngocola TaxID=28159 RepID=A0A2M8RTP7_9PAST|nr:efflux RND transporter periplasmic adaptor subunit [Caviibacterium pharyngocola]PJG82267.1 efflux RND transporter periplasmic adaptor subunit [Caviibacterium pharyngocola]